MRRPEAWPPEAEGPLEPPPSPAQPLKGWARRLALARTLPALGWRSVARVGAYRLRAKTLGFSGVMPDGAPLQGPYFTPEGRSATELPEELPPPSGAPGADPAAEAAWAEGRWLGFGAYDLTLSPELDWQADPLTGASPWPGDRRWEALPDFPPGGGDVKATWELGRFTWAPVLAAAARGRGPGAHLAHARLEALVASFAQGNPCYRGVHWKCGQEAALRALNLVVAQLLRFPSQAPAPALLSLLGLHGQRIVPTLAYAQGQDNNHGTSEAAGLWALGSLLALHGKCGAELLGEGWARQGRALLEERVLALVAEDGSFSQASLTYHRLFLDTMAMAAFVGDRLGRQPWGPQVAGRLAAATRWLSAMIHPTTGDGPNFGANDGAMLLTLGGPSYRDFRPTVQLASAWFLGERPLPPGPWEAALAWLGPQPLPPAGEALAPPSGQHFPQGGQLILAEGPWWVCGQLRPPRWRPQQADALHLDLWHQGHPVAVDGGSYGYASPQGPRLSGARAHNRVCPEGEEPMARLGPFLWASPWEGGDWRPEAQGGRLVGGQGEVDWGLGRTHRRHLALGPEGPVVRDELVGPWGQAELRWRLLGDWELDAEGPLARLTGPGGLGLEVEAQGEGGARFELRPGLESPNYLGLRPIQVLVATLGPRGAGWVSRWRGPA